MQFAKAEPPVLQRKRCALNWKKRDMKSKSSRVCNGTTPTSNDPSAPWVLRIVLIENEERPYEVVGGRSCLPSVP